MFWCKVSRNVPRNFRETCVRENAWNTCMKWKNFRDHTLFMYATKNTLYNLKAWHCRGKSHEVLCCLSCEQRETVTLKSPRATCTISKGLSIKQKYAEIGLGSWTGLWLSKLYFCKPRNLSTEKRWPVPNFPCLLRTQILYRRDTRSMKWPMSHSTSVLHDLCYWGVFEPNCTPDVAFCKHYVSTTRFVGKRNTFC